MLPIQAIDPMGRRVLVLSALAFVAYALVAHDAASRGVNGSVLWGVVVFVAFLGGTALFGGIGLVPGLLALGLYAIVRG